MCFHYNRAIFVLTQSAYRCAGSHSFCETNTARIWRNVQTRAYRLHICEAILQQPDSDMGADEPLCKPHHLTFGFSSDISVSLVVGIQNRQIPGFNRLPAAFCPMFSSLTGSRSGPLLRINDWSGENHVVSPYRERGVGDAHAWRILDHAHCRNHGARASKSLHELSL